MVESYPPSPDNVTKDPFVGTRYRALHIEATGQRGDLYVVEHRELGKRFAAKLLRRELLNDVRVVDRMRLEAQSLGRLRHPNIVNIVGFENTADGAPFVLMELLKGRNLEAEVLEHGAFAPHEASELIGQLLAALAAAHGIGIIHRDVRPRNLFLHRLPAGQRIAKLLDFGAVRVEPGVSERSPQPLAVPTTMGSPMVDLEFAAPEVASGQSADARSDVYQAGLVLGVALMGPRALDAIRASFAIPGALDNALSTTLDDVLGRHPELAAWRNLVLRATAEHPSKRFQNATDFREQLVMLGAAIANAPCLSPSRSGGHNLATSEQSVNPSLVTSRPRVLSQTPRLLVFLVLALVAALVVVALGSRFRGAP